MATKKPVYKDQYDPRIQKAVTAYENYGDYQSQNQAAIDRLMGDIQNRREFSYDFNADPLYQQYKDQYIRAGQNAMKDTMANAAALTGGYGNSYAATAGNQAYQQHLSGLNNVIPELYNAAYGRYQDKGTEMRQNLAMLQDADTIAYDRYQDGKNSLLDNISVLQSLQEAAYKQHRDNVSDWYTDADIAYQKERDAVSDSQWQKSFDYQKEQDRSSAYAAAVKAQEEAYNAKAPDYVVDYLKDNAGVLGEEEMGKNILRMFNDGNGFGEREAVNLLNQYAPGYTLDENGRLVKKTSRVYTYDEAVELISGTEKPLKGAAFAQRLGLAKKGDSRWTSLLNYDSYADYLTDFVKNHS